MTSQGASNMKHEHDGACLFCLRHQEHTPKQHKQSIKRAGRPDAQANASRVRNGAIK